MPVDYRVTSLKIENFRGVRSGCLALPPFAATYLIGSNNAGKSTFVYALALSMRGGGTHLFVPERFDFFCGRDGAHARTFNVELQFDAATETQYPTVQGVSKPIPVHGLRVEGRTDRNGKHSHQHVLFKDDGESILYSSRTQLSKSDKVAFEGHGLGFRPHYARMEDIREHLPEVWLLTPDNLHKSLYEWKTGPLRRLSTMLSRRLLEAEWVMEWRGEKRAMPATLRTTHEFFRDTVVAFPFWKEDLKPRLEAALGTYIGRQAGVALRPDLQSLEEWLIQQLQTAFAADAGGPLTPLDRMGQGWQSLVRIAALEVMCQYPDEVREKVVLLFEEPETYLHPHLRRKLRCVLDTLAAKGWTVVCATHAPEFVSFTVPRSVVRLWRKDDEVIAGVVDTAAVSHAARFQEKLDEHGNHEMLFGNRAILCEGKDDEYAAKAYLRKSHVDVDGRSVTVLEVGGIQNLPEYARMARELKIPWCAITDEDAEPRGAIKPATKAVREKLATLAGVGDCLLVWPESLEASLRVPGGTKALPSWQAQHLEALDLDALKKAYPGFAKVGASLKEWIET